MDAVGVVCEFDPLHRGHERLLLYGHDAARLCGLVSAASAHGPDARARFVPRSGAAARRYKIKMDRSNSSCPSVHQNLVEFASADAK